ncbi:MAG: hypothetical protein ACT4OZ_06180 [Gemmatimonadota bacterium]
MNQLFTPSSRHFRTSWRLFGAIALPTLLGASAAFSQTAIPVAPGTRVRVSASNLVAPIVGSYLEQRGDTAVFIEEGGGRGLWSLTLTQITKIEQSTGDRRSNTPYLIRGAVFGAPAGLLASLIALKVFSPDSGKEWSRGPTYAIGTLAGAGLGAAIGSRFARERWSDVPLPQRAALLPGRRGAVFLLGFDF